MGHPFRHPVARCRPARPGGLSPRLGRLGLDPRSALRRRRAPVKTPGPSARTRGPPRRTRRTGMRPFRPALNSGWNWLATNQMVRADDPDEPGVRRLVAEQQPAPSRAWQRLFIRAVAVSLADDLGPYTAAAEPGRETGRVEPSRIVPPLSSMSRWSGAEVDHRVLGGTCRTRSSSVLGLEISRRTRPRTGRGRVRGRGPVITGVVGGKDRPRSRGWRSRRDEIPAAPSRRVWGSPGKPRCRPSGPSRHATWPRPRGGAPGDAW
jgi:hypothetical protein